MKRTERVGAIIKILTDRPCTRFPLQYFCDRFDAAKPSISEDLTMAASALAVTGTGIIETVSGANGGAWFLPSISDASLAQLQEEFVQRLQDPSRILGGGFLYTSDLMYDTCLIDRLANVFARKFRDNGADYVATVETKGIPLAARTAHKLGIPLVIIRREAKVSEGSTVSINYFSGSYDRIQKMSIAKRAVTPGAKALIIDDFMRAGGSVRGIRDILAEFDVSVVGTGLAIASAKPEKKKIEAYTSVLILGEVDEENRRIQAFPNQHIFQ